MRLLKLGVLITVVGFGSPALAGYCCVDGSCIYIANLSTGATPLNSLCGHTLAGSGCTITMNQDESIASGSCVVDMQGSTTLKMNSHTINCSSTNCSAAIFTSHTFSNTANQVKGPGTISGCWYDAGSCDWPANDVIQDVTIDLAPAGSSCTYATSSYGLAWFKTNTRVVVGGGGSYGILAVDNATVTDSIVHDNGTGIIVYLFNNPSSGPTISGSLVVDNAINIRAYAGTHNLVDSTVRSGTQCNFEGSTAGVCKSATDVLHLSGTNFVENTILN